MVILLPCKDTLDYERQLSSFISQTIASQKNITFIDCKNSINPYIFDRRELPRITEHLFISRIERLHDFLDQLERVVFDPYFLQSDVLLVSSYLHLLEDAHRSEQKGFVHAITNRLALIEQQHNVRVVLVDFAKNTLFSTAA